MSAARNVELPELLVEWTTGRMSNYANYLVEVWEVELRDVVELLEPLVEVWDVELRLVVEIPELLEEVWEVVELREVVELLELLVDVWEVVELREGCQGLLEPLVEV